MSDKATRPLDQDQRQACPECGKMPFRDTHPEIGPAGTHLYQHVRCACGWTGVDIYTLSHLRTEPRLRRTGS